MVPLSVLDLSFVTSGSSGSVALRNTIDLARLADRLGYRRYWLAEHHNLPSVASPAPEILIGQIAAVTQQIRVGSGGVMLPNHAPLMVAERFKMLEALFPGRIDLGIGRAPGTDPMTAFALRRRQEADSDDDFLERLHELILWETRGFPPGHPFHTITAMPSDVSLPPIWLLGSSSYSAHLAASLGMGFAFAHHFATHDAVDAVQSYRQRFKPSAWRERPYAILGVSVVSADTDGEADRLASSADLSALLRARGRYVPLPTLEEAERYAYDSADLELIRRNRSRLFVGSPASVKRELVAMIDAAEADEVMVTSAIPDQEARRRSYTLIANEFGLTAHEPAAAEATLA